MNSFSRFRIMKNLSRILVVVLGLIAFGLLSCNSVETVTEQVIDVKLNPQLSKDSGLFTTLEVNILRTDSSVLIHKIFNGEWKDNADHELKGLNLGSNPPDKYLIEVKGFSGDTLKIHFFIPVDKDSVGTIVHVRIITTVALKSIELSDSAITLAITSKPRRVLVTWKPDSAKALIAFTAVDTSIARVDATGLITPRDTGSTRIIATANGNPLLRDTVLVHVIAAPTISSIAFVRPGPTVYVGSIGQSLKYTNLPDSITPAVEFFSSDTNVIQVSGSGLLKAKAEGKATITIQDLGSLKFDTLILSAKRDAPVLDAGPDQSVAPGQSVSFKVKVTQEFGGVLLTWDFNNDGNPEGSANSDTATATYTYSTANDYVVVFTAKDGEGNVITLVRRVRVGGNKPLISITSPKQDTTVNTPSIKVRYVVGGLPDSTVFSLIDGKNVLWIKKSNEFGKDSTSVAVTLDTLPPAKPIFTTVDTLVAKAPIWSWKGGGGGNGTFRIQFGSTSELETKLLTFTPAYNLKDSAYSLKVRERDSVGNWSAWVSQSIRVITTGPLAPQVVGSAVLTNAAPTWSWTGSGRVGAKFQIRLFKTGTAVAIDSIEATSLTYSPAATLFNNSNDIVFTARVREQDALGNWGGDGFADVHVDNVAPNSPVPNAIASPTSSATPTFTWVSGGGGDGNFQVKMDNNNFATGAIPVTGLTYTSPALTDGSHTLYVREKDAAGNGSAAPASIPVVVDLTAPTVTITGGNRTITSTATTLAFTTSDGTGSGVQGAVCRYGVSTVIATTTGTVWNCAISGLNTVTTTITVEATDRVARKGTASVVLTVNIPIPLVTIDAKYQRYTTASDTVTVSYRVDGAANSQFFTLSTQGDNAMTINGPVNAVGQRTSAIAHLFYWPKVVFVKLGNTTNQTGLNWDQAYGDLDAALQSTRGSTSGNQIWVTTGNYVRPDNASFSLAAGVSLYGGFATAGTGVQVSERILTSPSILTTPSLCDQRVVMTLVSRDTLDNFNFVPGCPGGYGKAFEIDGTGLLLANVKADGWNLGETNLITVTDNSSATIRNSSFSDNTSGFAPYFSVGSDATLDFFATVMNRNEFSVIDRGIISAYDGAKIRLLNGSQITSTKTVSTSYYPLELGAGTEVAVSTSSLVVPVGVNGEGRRCYSETLPCP